MKVLPIRPAPAPGEPLGSYIERLAHANHYEDFQVIRLLKQSGIEHAAALSQLINGQPLVEFGAPLVPNLEIPVKDWDLHTAAFTHYRTRVCPHCMQEEAWIRPHWRLKVMTACHMHECGLIDACSSCAAPISWNTALAGACHCGLRYSASTKSVGNAEVSLMRAIAQACQESSDWHWGGLKLQLTVSEWVKLLIYTGRFIQGPSLERPGQLPALEDLGVAQSIAQGTLALLRAWPDGYWQCLQSFVDAAPHDGAIRRVFQPLYGVIYGQLKAPAFQFLREGFETFLLEHWRGELCGRNRLFRQETVEGYARQGLAKVSRQIGVPRKMLKRLVHSDFIPGHRIQSINGTTREVITMDAAQVESLIPDRTAYLDLKNTAKLLGLKRSRLRQFVALGILSADSRPEWGQASHWYFRKTELQSFHARLQTLSAQHAIHDPVTLRDVLQFWQLTPQELRALFTAMGSPSLPIEMPAGSVIPALVLSRSSTRQWLEKQRRTTIPWVTPSQAAAELGIKEQVVYELISKNLLAADLVPGARAMLKRIPNDSLVAFQQKYVALAVLAKAANTASLHLANKLDAVPATGPRIDGSRQYFYRRADLQKQPFAASLEAASRPFFPTTTEHFTQPQPMDSMDNLSEDASHDQCAATRDRHEAA